MQYTDFTYGFSTSITSYVFSTDVRDILLASTGNRNIISLMSSPSFTCSSDRAIPTSLPGGANKQKTRCRNDFPAIFTKICNSNTYTTKQLHDSVIQKKIDSVSYVYIS